MSESDPTDMGDIFDELEELEGMIRSEQAREQVRETMRVAMEASGNAGPFGRVVRGVGHEDLAEALLGSVRSGIPMAVEGGTQEVGEFIATRPASLVGTLAFTVLLMVGIVYVADFQDVQVTNPILGVIPRRLVGVLGVSPLTAAALVTAWGRADWAEPWIVTADVVVAFVPMSIGAALGNLLPESQGGRPGETAIL